MPGPSLVCCLFILITTGSSGPGVLSPGASAGDAFTSIWNGVWVLENFPICRCCKCIAVTLHAFGRMQLPPRKIGQPNARCLHAGKLSLAFWSVDDNHWECTLF
eukprot:scaffold77079_cov60-Phaeocystis_antarctica.AAC.1